MYTLEQIKNFTPERRNDVIDEIINFCDTPCTGICAYIEDKTDYMNRCIPRNQYFIALKIPLVKDFGICWFETMEQRITFLKAQKKAE